MNIKCILCSYEIWSYCTLKKFKIEDIEADIICEDFKELNYDF